jgi:enoyl-[acyl-carrier protein] reductase I
MVEKGKLYVVMGLLDPDSIAWHIGQKIQAMGGRVLYTIQSEMLKGVCLDLSEKLTDAQRAAIEFRYCDVTEDEQIEAVFRDLGPVAGLVHSLAYANPRVLLGESPHSDNYREIMKSYHVSCVSLASAVRCALPNFAAAGGGSVLTLTFDSRCAYTHYNWMSANKAGLEALVRVLARFHGKDNIRVNAISAGPLRTLAATKIPAFNENANLWNRSSPIGWDLDTGREDVAHAAAFLLGPYARRITGQVLFVDGGSSAVRGDLMDFERPPAP